MADITSPLIAGLAPITSRVRQDVTAMRMPDGSSRWTRDPLTPERLAKHMNGGPARGACPIKEGESVTLLGLLDFDSHKGEIDWVQMGEVVGRVVEHLEQMGMSPVVFRSSGGAGVHVYLLWDEPQDAYSVRQFLGSVLTACGLKDGAGGVKQGEVEVFPKQDSVALNKFGNQAILPLANKSVPLVLDNVEELW